MIEISGELTKDFQILHQTGFKNFESVKKESGMVLKNYPEEQRARYKIVSYFERDLKDAYAAADLVISRASSGSIFEISAFGKPSVLIPLPSEVVGEHQIKNAYEYAKTGAAIVVEQANLTPNVFMLQLKKLFSEPEKLKTMSESAKNFSKPEAAKIIAEEIVRLVNKS
jgi:UDP-N-acetylglucosamine--N-acetylmuramyl-(pentapeptide) pyrophosphoryl-undecaprenol N-acetylglucosamine transferase